MKNTLVKSFIAVAVGALMMVGSASASFVDEWGIVSPNDITTQHVYDAKKDFGYSIWTDDLERTSWHIRWYDGTGTAGDLGPTQFTGSIAMEGNNADYFAFRFESNDSLTALSNQNATYVSYINQGNDGIDFVISQIYAPSFVGFNLSYMGFQVAGSDVYLGSQTVASLGIGLGKEGQDGDFSVAAPVPEPATMLLFGTGLMGLMGIARGRRKKK